MIIEKIIYSEELSFYFYYSENDLNIFINNDRYKKNKQGINRKILLLFFLNEFFEDIYQNKSSSNGYIVHNLKEKLEKQFSGNNDISKIIKDLDITTIDDAIKNIRNDFRKISEKISILKSPHLKINIEEKEINVIDLQNNSLDELNKHLDKLKSSNHIYVYNLINEKISELKKVTITTTIVKTQNTENKDISTKIFSCDELIGRENFIQKIHNEFKSKNKIFIQGNKGIGKTSVCKKYLNNYKDDYLYYGYFDYQDSIKKTIISQFYNNLSNSKRIENLTNDISDENFKNIVTFLKTIIENKDKNSIIVINNFTNTNDNSLSAILELKNLKILINSYIQNINGFSENEKLELGHIKEDKLIELFEKYSDNKISEKEKLKEILKKVSYNTLVIEIIAKIYKKTLECNSKYNIESLKNDLEERIIKKFSNLNIITNYTEEEKFSNIISALFGISNLSSEEKHLLYKISIFPYSKEISKDMFLESNIETHLINLSEQSWIKYKDNNIFMEDIVKESIRFQLQEDNSLNKESFYNQFVENTFKYIDEIINNNYITSNEYVTYFEDFCNNNDLLKNINPLNKIKLLYSYSTTKYYNGYLDKLEDKLNEYFNIIQENKSNFQNFSDEDKNFISKAICRIPLIILDKSIKKEDLSSLNDSIRYIQEDLIWLQKGSRRYSINKNSESKILFRIYELGNNNNNLQKAINTLNEAVNNTENYLYNLLKNNNDSSSNYNKMLYDIELSFDLNSNNKIIFGIIEKLNSFDKKIILEIRYLSLFYHNLALMYFTNKDIDKALEFCSKSITIKHFIYDNDKDNTNEINLSMSKELLARIKENKNLYESAINSIQKIFNNSKTNFNRIKLARMYYNYNKLFGNKYNISDLNITLEIYSKEDFH